MDEIEAINEIVFDILGEDHEMVVRIKSEDDFVPVIPVVVECMGKLNERLKLIEADLYCSSIRRDN